MYNLHNMIIEDKHELYAPAEFGRKTPPPGIEIAEDENV